MKGFTKCDLNQFHYFLHNFDLGMFRHLRPSTDPEIGIFERIPDAMEGLPLTLPEYVLYPYTTMIGVYDNPHGV